MSAQTMEHKVAGWSGDQLRTARLRMGLTTEQVERQLFFQPGYVDAIEQGNFKNLPGTLFVKGYIRAYAKLLQLSPHQFVQELQEQVAHYDLMPAIEPKPAFTSTAFANAAFPDSTFANKPNWDQKAAKGKQSVSWRLWLLVPLVTVLLLAMWWPQLTPMINSALAPFNLHLPELSVPQMVGLSSEITLEATPAVNVDVAEVGAAPNDFASLINAAESSSAEPTANTAPSEALPAFINNTAINTTDINTTDINSTQTNAAPTQPFMPVENSAVATVVPVKPLGDGRWQIGAKDATRARDAGTEDQLQIKLKSSTWLQITDAVGVNQPLKSYMANAELKITGVAPFTITTGDVKALSLRFNKQEVSL